MSLPILAPEARVVLLTAGPPHNDAAIRALIERGLHEPSLAYLVHWERAVLSVWRRLDALLGPRAQVVELLRPGAAVWEFRLLQMEDLLARLTERLDRAGIDVMLLKGAGLALEHYGTLTGRPMFDLDVLVRPERAEEAWRLAQEEGWRSDFGKYPEEAYRSHYHLSPLEDIAGTGARLEIHTAPGPRGSMLGLSAADFWKGSRSVEAAGRTFTVPGAGQQLLHACVHFAWLHQVQDKAWRTFYDVWALVETEAVDWDGFIALARASRAETCAYWTLRLARRLSRIEVPERVISALQPRMPAVALSSLERHFALGLFPFADACPSVRLGQLFWRIGLNRGAKDAGVELAGGLPAPAGRAGAEGMRMVRRADRSRRRRAWARYLRATVLGRPGQHRIRPVA